MSADQEEVVQKNDKATPLPTQGMVGHSGPHGPHKASLEGTATLRITTGPAPHLLAASRVHTTVSVKGLPCAPPHIHCLT